MAAEALKFEVPVVAEETKDAGAGGAAVEASIEEESTATFEPVVVLEEVETVSGEEDEDVILKM
jgi:Ran-binding protein 1